jgi:hypothetical protein
MVAISTACSAVTARGSRRASRGSSAASCMARQISVWLETFSASVPSAIGTPAASSSGHLPVCVVPLASFNADDGFCDIRAPAAATSATSLSSRLVM